MVNDSLAPEPIAFRYKGCFETGAMDRGHHTNTNSCTQICICWKENPLKTRMNLIRKMARQPRLTQHNRGPKSGRTLKEAPPKPVRQDCRVDGEPPVDRGEGRSILTSSSITWLLFTLPLLIMRSCMQHCDTASSTSLELRAASMSCCFRPSGITSIKGGTCKQLLGEGQRCIICSKKFSKLRTFLWKLCPSR